MWVGDHKERLLTSGSSYTNSTTNATIDYYEIEVKSLQQQIYPNLNPTELIGYDGISPGPTFVMQQGRGKLISCHSRDFTMIAHLAIFQRLLLDLRTMARWIFPLTFTGNTVSRIRPWILWMHSETLSHRSCPIWWMGRGHVGTWPVQGILCERNIRVLRLIPIQDYYYPNAQNARTIWYHVRFRVFVPIHTKVVSELTATGPCRICHRRAYL